MDIPQLLERLNELYPGSFADDLAISTWAPWYAKEVAPGPDLQTALERCVAHIGKRKSPPKPGELAKFYPSPKQIKADAAPVLPDPTIWAETVMEMPEGQEALRNSAGREAWIWARKHRGQVPNADDVAVWIADTVSGLRKGDEIRTWAPTALNRSLLEVYDAMFEFERDLHKKFLKVAA